MNIYIYDAESIVVILSDWLVPVWILYSCKSGFLITD